MIWLSGRNDIPAVMELWKLGACVLLLHGDEPGFDPKAPCRKWAKQRAPLNSIDTHLGGFAMALAARINGRWEYLCVVDVDATDRSEAETRAVIEELAGGPAAAWIPSIEKGWHAVFAGLPGATPQYRYQLDGIIGEVLTGRRVCVSLWDPRRMIPAVRAVRKGNVVMFDPQCLPLRVQDQDQKQADGASPVARNVRDGLPPSRDLFRGGRRESTHGGRAFPC